MILMATTLPVTLSLASHTVPDALKSQVNAIKDKEKLNQKLGISIENVYICLKESFYWMGNFVIRVDEGL